MVFCRENKNMEANKNAWKAFFEIIRYHPGIVDDLVKSQKLGQFLDIVTTGGGHIVIVNSLRYISKVVNIFV